MLEYLRTHGVRACVRTYRADLVVIARPEARIFVRGFACFCMRCGGTAACVGEGVDTDIRHLLECDRRSLTPLSRTRIRTRIV